MQLLIILALLLYGGKTGGKNILSEVKPVLETFGGEEIKEALKNAEEISSVLSAVQSFTGSAPASEQNTNLSDFGTFTENSSVAFPLSPISAIADKDITYSLSKYIAQN
ncbi:MAG: hypothetical protein OSJ68_09215 [Clostridia bacterium]|nr:hypothetical protein [Clostridia bacterium]